MSVEPPLVVCLGYAAAEHHQAFRPPGHRVGGECSDREVADQPAVLVQHRGQRDAPGSGQPVGQDPVEKGPRVGAGELVLREVGRLDQPDVLAHGPALLADSVPGVRPAQGRRLEALGPRGDVLAALEPQRVLEPVRRTPDGVRRVQAAVDRGGQERPSRGELFVGVGDPEPAAVVLAHLRVRVRRGGPLAVPRDIHPPHVEARISLRDPVGQRQPDAAALAEPGHHPARDPVASLTPDRTDEGVAVRGKGERSVDDGLDADLVKDREVVERDGEVVRDPVEVRREQLVPEVPRSRLRGPGDAVRLVGAEQQPVALLAHVDLAREVHRVEPRRTVELGHRLGDEVHVLHRQHRQLDAAHAADLARPQAAGVDEVLAGDGALLSTVELPGLVRQLTDRLDPGVLDNLGAGELGRPREGTGHARRIDVALDRVEHRADEVLLVHHRQELRRLGHADQLGLETQIAVAGMGQPEPVHPFLGVGQEHPSGEMDAAVDPGDALDLVVQLDGVLLQARDIRVAVQGVHATGRVPGRAAGQLAALEQYRVGHSGLGQVVEHARPDHTAADHHDVGGTPHPALLAAGQKSVFTPPSATRRSTYSSSSATTSGAIAGC